MSHRRSTGRRDRWREEVTPFVTCGRLRGAECLSGFCAATGEMDECPRHRERRESVALRGAEQLVKRCVRRAPAKADQYAEGGIEDAAALHVERELGGNPVSRHALLTSRGASTDARHRHGPNHCHDLCASSAVARPSRTSECICDYLGTKPCRRRPTSWPAGRYRSTSSAIAGAKLDLSACGVCSPVRLRARDGRPTLWRGSARLYPRPTEDDWAQVRKGTPIRSAARQQCRGTSVL
jgi:hypothetical protein